MKYPFRWGNSRKSIKQPVQINDFCAGIFVHIITGLVIKYQIGYLNKANQDLKYIATGNSISGFVLLESLLE